MKKPQVWQYFIHGLLPSSLRFRGLWSLLHINVAFKSASFSFQSQLEFRGVVSRLPESGEFQPKCKLKTSPSRDAVTSVQLP